MIGVAWYFSWAALTVVLYAEYRAMVAMLGSTKRLAKVFQPGTKGENPVVSDTDPPNSRNLGVGIPEFEAHAVGTGLQITRSTIVGKKSMLVFCRPVEIAELDDRLVALFLYRCWLRTDNDVYLFVLGDGAAALRSRIAALPFAFRDQVVVAVDDGRLRAAYDLRETPCALETTPLGTVCRVGRFLEAEAALPGSGHVGR